MKYVSIDIETTGTDSQSNQILEFGAIIEDTELKLPYEKCPKFHKIIWHDCIVGHPVALGMNGELIKEIATEQEKRKNLGFEYAAKYDFLIDGSELAQKFASFLHACKIYGKFTAAGKNFASFDRQFILNLRNSELIQLHYRSIEPSMFYIDWKKDETVPDSMTCKKRARLKEQMLHRAMNDAWDMILLLRQQY